MYVGLDTETKNLGFDIMKDNECMLSLQLGDNFNQKIFWADSSNIGLNLESAKKEIVKLLAKNVTFVGYNIKGFDLPMMKKFLNVDIPVSQILDLCLCQPQRIAQLTGRNHARLEEACGAFGIDASHKQRMDEKSKAYKTNEDFKARSLVRAKELVREKGWSFDLSYRVARDKIAGGNAIYDAYLEFAKSGGQKNTLFYEYAVGDVISEYQLLKKLGY